MAALSDGQAVVEITKNDTVVRVNNQGVIVNNLYTGSDIYGLLLQGSHLFVLHLNGTIVQMKLDGLILNVYNTGISAVYNFGSQHSDLCDIDQNLLLLPSFWGDVYTYNISSQTVKLHVNNLNFPISANRGCVDGSVVYVVCERSAHKVHVYNVSWSLVTSFGSYGVGDGQMIRPEATVMSDQGYIFVADTQNHRVSMFTSDGQFVNHIINCGHEKPWYLSVRGKYLWVGTDYGRVTRYIL